MERQVKKLGFGALLALVHHSSNRSGILALHPDMADTPSPGAALIAGKSPAGVRCLPVPDQSDE